MTDANSTPCEGFCLELMRLDAQETKALAKASRAAGAAARRGKAVYKGIVMSVPQCSTWAAEKPEGS